MKKKFISRPSLDRLNLNLKNVMVKSWINASQKNVRFCRQSSNVDGESRAVTSAAERSAESHDEQARKWPKSLARKPLPG